MSAREAVVRGCLVALALVHLVPVVGVIGPDRLSTLYGFPIEGTDLTILMRHRAVLFGILGALTLVAVWRPALRATALVAAGVSLVSFLALALGTGGYNEALGRLIVGDSVALVPLLIALALEWRRS